MNIALNRSFNLNPVINSNYMFPIPSGVVSNYLSWLYGGLETDSTNTVNDKIDTIGTVSYTNNNCSSFDGIADFVTRTGVGHNTNSYIKFILEYSSDTDEMQVYENGDSNSNFNSAMTINSTLDASNKIALGISPTTNANETGSILKYNGTMIVGEMYEIIGYTDSSGNAVSGTVRQLGTNTYNDMTLSGSGRSRIGGFSLNELRIGIRPGGSFPYSGKISLVEIGDILRYTFASGVHVLEPDTSGNNNDGNISTSSAVAMSTTEDNIIPYNIEEGFTLLVHSTSPDLYWPYANGSPMGTSNYPLGYSADSEHPGGFLHNGAESTITFPSGVGTLSGLTKTYQEILALAQSSNGTDDWNFSYGDTTEPIIDGLYYDPALTGRSATQLLNFLNSRHS